MMERGVMIAEPVKRKPGQPEKSMQEKYCVLQDYYLQVEKVRHQKRRDGKKINPAEAGRLLARRGGLAWIVGGDARMLPTERKMREGRYGLCRQGQRLKLYREDQGVVYVRRLVERHETIMTRYYEAVRFARENENVQFAWDNMVRDLCGLPRLLPKHKLFWR
jgi:hypothetical protein